MGATAGLCSCCLHNNRSFFRCEYERIDLVKKIIYNGLTIAIIDILTDKLLPYDTFDAFCVSTLSFITRFDV